MIDLFGHFEKYGFKVFLPSLRAQISPVNGEVGMRKGEGGGGMRKGEVGMRKGEGDMSKSFT